MQEDRNGLLDSHIAFRERQGRKKEENISSELGKKNHAKNTEFQTGGFQVVSFRRWQMLHGTA
jgi:hypothetical protein